MNRLTFILASAIAVLCGAIGLSQTMTVTTANVGTLTVVGAGASVNNVGLSNYWKFDDATIAQSVWLDDSVGSPDSSLLTYSDNAIYPGTAVGLISGALLMTATHATYAYTNNIWPLTNQAWSVTGWFYPAVTNSTITILCKGETGSRQLAILMDTASVLTAYTSTTGDSWDKTVSSSAQMKTGGWLFFAVVHDVSGNKLDFYIGDTTAMRATNSLGTLGALYGASSQSLYLGAMYGGSANWDGRLDELGIWHKAMTADEVITEWNSGAGTTHP